MLDPDAIVQNGIKVLQQKLAGIIHELNAEAGGADAEFAGPRSPDLAGAAGAGGDNWQEGFATPYGNGNQSSWGGAGGATPYGTSTTPYGNSGGWN